MARLKSILILYTACTNFNLDYMEKKNDDDNTIDFSIICSKYSF